MPVCTMVPMTTVYTCSGKTLEDPKFSPLVDPEALWKQEVKTMAELLPAWLRIENMLENMCNASWQMRDILVKNV